MARHPDWFHRLDAISQTVGEAGQLEWLGRNELKAVFQCSERDSIRLLHKFGAVTHHDALFVPRSDLIAQLDAIRQSATYAAFLRQRENVAGHLATARTEAQTRHFTIPHTNEVLPALGSLPPTITWRRTDPAGIARFQVLYRDGGDLMSQLAEFLAAAGVNREEFFAATEPDDGSDR